MEFLRTGKPFGNKIVQRFVSATESKIIDCHSKNLQCQVQLLKALCETQFDENERFRSKLKEDQNEEPSKMVTRRTCNKLIQWQRTSPIGSDSKNYIYWYLNGREMSSERSYLLVQMLDYIERLYKTDQQQENQHIGNRYRKNVQSYLLTSIRCVEKI